MKTTNDTVKENTNTFSTVSFLPKNLVRYARQATSPFCLFSWLAGGGLAIFSLPPAPTCEAHGIGEDER